MAMASFDVKVEPQTLYECCMNADTIVRQWYLGNHVTAVPVPVNWMSVRSPEAVRKPNYLSFLPSDDSQLSTKRPKLAHSLKMTTVFPVPIFPEL
jgi:hypothetical protein